MQLLWEHSCKRLKLAQVLDQLGAFLTLWPRARSASTVSAGMRPSTPSASGYLGSYPIVTSQDSSTTLYQVPYNIQWLLF